MRFAVNLDPVEVLAFYRAFGKGPFRLVPLRNEITPSGGQKALFRWFSSSACATEFSFHALHKGEQGKTDCLAVPAKLQQIDAEFAALPFTDDCAGVANFLGYLCLSQAGFMTRILEERQDCPVLGLMDR